MRVRKLTLAVGLVAALGAEMAAALGLGEIKLNSALNQPLDAEIKLLQIRNLTADEILVALASREDFDRAGVERLFFLSDLRFRVVLDHPSGPIVRVTSRKPVREPYLNFLLETQWPTGRLLREYTLLMDLPVFGDQPAAPVRGAQTRPQAAAPPRPAAPPPAPPRAAPEYSQPQQPGRASPSRTVDVYGPVTSNDTLWQIAQRVRPDRSVSIQQTMLALQRINPGAFINNNINLLRRGQVLRVPSLDEIYSLSAQQAVAEVAIQNAQWAGGEAGGRVTGAQLDGGRRTASDGGARPSGQGRVKLGAPGDAESALAGRGSGATDGDIEALENELAITQEQLDKSQRDNAELSSRIGDLEAQIETMERLVEVSQQELRALQLASQQGEGAVTDGAAADAGAAVDIDLSAVGETVDGGETAAAADITAEAAAADSAAAAAPAPAPAAATAQAAEPDPTKVVRSQPPKPKSFMDTLLDNILWLGAGLAAVLGAILLFMRRRSEAVAEDEAIGDFDHFDDNNVFAEQESDPVADDLEMPDEVEAPQETFAEELEDTDSVEQALETVEAETSDVVGEADIYIAYGKFDQAEDMLRKVLDDNPARTDVRLKLLEVFSESRQVQKFDRDYAELLTYNDTAANQRAAELRSHIPDAGDFDAAAPAAAEPDLDAELEAAEDAGELSLELDLDEAAAGAAESDFEDLDLDLSLDTDDELDTRAGGDLAGADDSLELDLDLDETDLAEAPAASRKEDPALDLESADTELSLDLQDTNTDLDDLTLELDQAGDAVADTADDALALDLSLDEDLDDLDLADAGAEAAAAGQGAAADALDTSLDTLDTSLDESLDSDDFDLEMGDVDMAALDQEVEELAANLDLDDAGDGSAGVAELDMEAELDGLDIEEGDLDMPAKPAMEEPVTDFDTLQPAQSGSGAEVVELQALESADDEVFDTALAAVPDNASAGDTLAAANDTDIDSAALDRGADLSDENAELDFLADTDEAATKLDLARAYIDMGDKDGAKDILDEVAEEGNDQQRHEAQELLSRM